MKKRVITKEEMKFFGLKKIYPVTSSENRIHLLRDDKKFKKFSSDYQKLSEPKNMSLFEDLKSQTELYGISTFGFPQHVVASSKMLYGYIADYAKGQPLGEDVSNVLIDYIIYLAEKLESAIEIISGNGCQIEDLHEDNIIVSGEEVTVIDTDFYTFAHCKETEVLIQYNLKLLSNCLIHLIAPSISVSDVLKDSELKVSYYLCTQGKYKCSEFIKLLITKLTYRKYEKIDTVKELQMKVQR